MSKKQAVPQSQKKGLFLRVEYQFHDDLKKLSEKEDVSMTDMIIKAVKIYEAYVK